MSSSEIDASTPIVFGEGHGDAQPEFLPSADGKEPRLRIRPVTPAGEVDADGCMSDIPHHFSGGQTHTPDEGVWSRRDTSRQLARAAKAAAAAAAEKPAAETVMDEKAQGGQITR